MNIIGITGTIGAGKGTLVEHLVKERGYTHLSVRSLLLEEIEKRGMEPTRESMFTVANDLRAQSPSYIMETLYKKAVALKKDCIIESIRTIGEIEGLRKLGHFYLFAVVADIKIRYERILMRGNSTDNISFEEFVEQENRESISNDPGKQNLPACIKQAHVVLENNGSKEELFQKVEDAFRHLSTARLS